MHKKSNSLVTFLEKNRNKKKVFTNGCFDIMHVGHIEYLNEAKALGDILIIGLNSDKSIKAIKGEERPINNEIDRKLFLENIKAVDFVEIFEEENPKELIEAISPNILVKGGDWKIDQIIGSEFVLKNGGEVKSLSFKNGYSSTNLIDKIRTL